jgi:hypothetical protein
MGKLVWTSLVVAIALMVLLAWRLKPRIYAARKDGCRLLPGRTDAYECGLDLRVTLREGDREPGPHAERVHAYWDGQWAAPKTARQAGPRRPASRPGRKSPPQAPRGSIRP